jgi:hypothetical protein
MILNVPVAASLGVLTTELLRISVLWKTLDTSLALTQVL